MPRGGKVPLLGETAAIISYDTKLFGLMDLPHLWTTLRVDHGRLDNAARYPQLHSPSNNEGILFLEGMKEKKREDCRGSGAILPCYDVQAEDSFTTRKPGIPQVHWVLHAAYAGTANDALIFARSKDRASTRGVPARSLPPWLM
jgi:hypothetical protein